MCTIGCLTFHLHSIIVFTVVQCCSIFSDICQPVHIADCSLSWVCSDCRAVVNLFKHSIRLIWYIVNMHDALANPKKVNCFSCLIRYYSYAKAMSSRTALFLSIIRRKILTVACFLPTFSWQVSDSSAHHRLPTTYALPQYPCRQCACGRETTEYAQGPDFRNKCRELSNVILRQTFTLYALFRTVLCVPPPF
jgi:hypothetical protein